MVGIDYTGVFNITQLHDEIEAAQIAALQPIAPEAGDDYSGPPLPPLAVYGISAEEVGDDGTSAEVTITVPDDLPKAARTQLDQLVAAHKPSAANEPARVQRVAEITAILDTTDKWAARHVEDGISLTPERISYRVALRTLAHDVATGAAAADAPLPDEPPPPSVPKTAKAKQ